VGGAELRPRRLPAAVVEVGGQHLELEVDHRLEQARFDMGAAAGAPLPDQGGEDALDDGVAGEQVGHGEAEGDRSLVGVAVQPHHAGAGLRQEVLPRPAARQGPSARRSR
jgi:hypothetical protein